MANGSSRVLPVILSVVVAFAAGWLVGRSATAQPAPAPKPTVVAGDHYIRVGPTAKEVSEPQAEISQSQDHRVVWTAKDPKHALTIAFKAIDFPRAAGGEPPFAGPNGKDLEIKCNPGSFCNPGPINPKLPKLTRNQKLNYKYWQILDGPSGYHDQADGMIIIDP